MNTPGLTHDATINTLPYTPHPDMSGIGPRGASALGSALARNRRLHTLVLRASLVCVGVMPDLFVTCVGRFQRDWGGRRSGDREGTGGQPSTDALVFRYRHPLPPPTPPQPLYATPTSPKATTASARAGSRPWPRHWRPTTSSRTCTSVSACEGWSIGWCWTGGCSIGQITPSLPI